MVKQLHYSNLAMTELLFVPTASDFSVGECWGYKKFFDLAKLVRYTLSTKFMLYLILLHPLLYIQRSGEFLVNDTLLLKLSIRQPTFHQRCKDMQLYINGLEKKMVSLNQQLKVSIYFLLSNDNTTIDCFYTESTKRRKVKFANSPYNTTDKFLPLSLVKHTC